MKQQTNIRSTLTKEEQTNPQKRIDDYINTPGKLPMWKFRSQLTFQISKAMAGYELSDIINYYILDTDVYLETRKMNLQRPLVWTLDQKRELIYSVLKGIYIPPITAVNHSMDDTHNNRVLKIIDGKQRLTSLLSFYKGEFSILFEEKEYFFNDLADQAKREINDCLRFDIAYSYHNAPISDEELITWFHMINFSGTPQDKAHMDNLMK